MRLSVLAIASLLALPAMVHAQDGGFGIKGGLSYGNVSNSGALPGNVSQRSGFAVGLSAATGGMLGFGIEGLYAERGVTSAMPGASRKLDYLDVPVYVRLALPLPAITPFAYAGPQGSYELKCTTDLGNCADAGRPKLTYSGVIGAGVRIAALAGVSVEARYIYGLSDLKLNTVSTASSYQTRSFLLLAGFSF